MEKLQKPRRKSKDDTTEHVEHNNPVEADLSDSDALLAEIDEVLAEQDAEQESEAAKRAAYIEKLKSINFIGRGTDPCVGVIRVSEDMVEPLLSTGLYKESDCEGC